MNEKLRDDKIIIRLATKEDMVEVSEMIQGLANSQGMPSGPKLSVKDLQRDGFETEWPRFQCKIAEFEKSGVVAGFSIFVPTYSTWEGRSMVLQNLYVKEEYRRLGLGRMLFQDVASGALNLTELEGAQYYRLSGAALRAVGEEPQ